MSEAALASPLVAGAYLVTTILFLLGLRRAAIARGSGAGRMGVAGLLIAMAATVYTLDAVSLPEMAGVMLAGGGIGWLAIRGTRLAPPRLIATLQGVTGLVVLLLAGAIWLDAAAFGLDRNNPAVIFPLGVCVAMGAVSAIGSLVLLFNWDAPAGAAPAALAVLNRGMGLAIAAAGFLLSNGAMLVAGGLLAASAIALGVAMRKSRGRGLPMERPLP